MHFINRIRPVGCERVGLCYENKMFVVNDVIIVIVIGLNIPSSKLPIIIRIRGNIGCGIRSYGR